jgi:4-hydroxy-tetrahydrodipicolinate synthase
MIPALKSAIAHYGGDRSWTAVRPPLVELTGEQSSSLFSELDDAGFTMAMLPEKVF